MRHTYKKFITLIMVSTISFRTIAIIPETLASLALGGGAYYYHTYKANQANSQEPSNYDPKKPRCNVPALVGACPPEICPIIERVKEYNDKAKIGYISLHRDDVSQKNAHNVLLLEGSTGIGKTRLAEAIATSTDSHFANIYCASLLSSFFGGTAAEMNKSIKEAIAEGEAKKRLVVILLDEVDAFASHYNSTASMESDAAYKALWSCIDDNKKNPYVLFVMTTNRIDKLPVPLRNRASYIIHMNNPDAQQRKELLTYFFKLTTAQELTECCSNEHIESIVKETKNFSIRNLEVLCEKAHVMALADKEKMSYEYLKQAVAIEKKEVTSQQAPTKEELAEQRAQRDEFRANATLSLHAINTVTQLYNVFKYPTNPEPPKNPEPCV